MPRIPARFAPMLSTTSPGGAQVTSAELTSALQGATSAEIATLKAQATDAVADGAAFQKLVGSTAPAATAAPISTLRDHPAARTLLAGTLNLSSANAAQNKETVVVLQRALMKIGAHHPDARTRPELMMMPWGADGGLGSATVAAINSALTMAGRTDLKLASSSSPVTKAVAEVIDQLLAATPRIMHPSTVNVPGPTTTSTTTATALWGRTGTPVESTGTGLHARWTATLEKLDAEQPRWNGPRANLPVAARFLLNELDDAMARPASFQLNRVNSVINGWLFSRDIENYGEPDHWASPLEFLEKQRGDCEDYCIAKYNQLKRMGISEDKMRLLIVLERTSGEAHAVLAVDLPDATYILDNLSTTVKKQQDVVDAQGNPRYVPLLGLSRNKRWLYT